MNGEVLMLACVVAAGLAYGTHLAREERRSEAQCIVDVVPMMLEADAGVWPALTFTCANEGTR